MAVTVSLNVTPSNPARGQEVTATYVVTGNTGTPAGPEQTATVSGVAVIGGDTLNVTTALTLPGTPAVPALPETFDAPVVDGRTFTATADPKVWKLTV